MFGDLELRVIAALQGPLYWSEKESEILSWGRLLTCSLISCDCLQDVPLLQGHGQGVPPAQQPYSQILNLQLFFNHENSAPHPEYSKGQFGVHYGVRFCILLANWNAVRVGEQQIADTEVQSHGVQSGGVKLTGVQFGPLLELWRSIIRSHGGKQFRVREVGDVSAGGRPEGQNSEKPQNIRELIRREVKTGKMLERTVRRTVKRLLIHSKSTLVDEQDN